MLVEVRMYVKGSYLKPMVGVVVLDLQDVIVYGEEVAGGRHPVGQHESLGGVAEVQVGQHPGDQVLAGKDGGNFGHEALHRSNGNAGILLLNE